MAQPTTSQHTTPPQHAATPGVGQTPGSAGRMSPMVDARAQTFDTPPADPVLFDEPDMVALLRLYPHAKSHEELRSLAMEAGMAAKEAGLRLRAAQDVDTAPPADDRPHHRPAAEGKNDR